MLLACFSSKGSNQFKLHSIVKYHTENNYIECITCVKLGIIKVIVRKLKTTLTVMLWIRTHIVPTTTV